MRVPRGKRRNEGSPFQGIDTILKGIYNTINYRGRNEGSPFQGIDTHNAALFL